MAYAAKGSESAFRALVARHADLVFATALRQVGDRGLAEEISQNVFIALARKAPRLTGCETLAGWLHKCTILEARARIRSELRRRAREQTAAELSDLHHAGESSIQALLPFVDEALLSLREADRLALISRFFEDRALREVGQLLGVDEDAARKRVSRALDKVAAFFKARGFALPAQGGAAVLLAQSVQAAPATLASTAAQAGLSAAGSTSALALVLIQFMAVSKIKLAVACMAVASLPLLWQSQVAAGLRESETELRTGLLKQEEELSALETEHRRIRQALQLISAERATAEMRAASLAAQRSGQSVAAPYQWNDASPLVRVDKRILQDIPIRAVSTHHGQLSAEIRETLQINDAEAEQIQAVLNEFVHAIDQVQSAKMRRVEPLDSDLNGHKREETMVFEIPDCTTEHNDLRERLFASLKTTLGSERFALFRSALRQWLRIEEQSGGISSSLRALPEAHRVRYFKPTPESPHIGDGVSVENGSIFNSQVQPENIKEMFRPYLADWIALSKELREDHFARERAELAAEPVHASE